MTGTPGFPRRHQRDQPHPGQFEACIAVLSRVNQSISTHNRWQHVQYRGSTITSTPGRPPRTCPVPRSGADACRSTGGADVRDVRSDELDGESDNWRPTPYHTGARSCHRCGGVKGRSAHAECGAELKGRRDDEGHSVRRGNPTGGDSNGQGGVPRDPGQVSG